MLLKQNVSEKIRDKLAHCDDLVIRSFPEINIEVMFFGHLIGERELYDNVIMPFSEVTNDELKSLLKRKEYKIKTNLNEIIKGVLEGKAAIIYKNTDAYLIDIYVPKTRSVTIAEIETVIIG